MNITDLLFNPESSRPESGNNFISDLLINIVTELDNETRVVGSALEALEYDDAHRKHIGRNFGRAWDPLKEIGIVSHAIDGDPAEIVREMAIDPIERLRDQVDVDSNNKYLDKIVDDSFTDKERAQKTVEAAFASANYTPVQIPVDFTEF